MKGKKIKNIRAIYRTVEFSEFLNQADERTLEKIAYLSEILQTQPIINSKIAKRLVGTILYEIRIKVDNEYLILTYTIIEHENINQHKSYLYYLLLKNQPKITINK